MYYTGQGVIQNYAEAVKWYRKAAAQGYAKAQSNLGLMYANGQGVTRNDAEAVKWYHKAANQGIAAAQSNLGAMYANGQGVTRNYVCAYMWFSLATARGNTTAAKYIDIVAQRMNRADMSRAQKLAAAWTPKSKACCPR